MDRTAGLAKDTHEEKSISTWNGFVALAVGLALLALAAYLFYDMMSTARADQSGISLGRLLATIIVFIASLLILLGLYTLQPNEAAIVQLFGDYRGTTRTPGLRAINPFYTRKKISLRARNLNGEGLKVNDKRGNPIEIVLCAESEVQPVINTGTLYT